MATPPHELVLRRAVKRQSGCWIAGTSPDKDGYCQVTDCTGLKPVTRRSHRVIWEHFNGPIPVDMVIDHLCRTRRCVNPDHMEIVTRGENTRRGGASLKTHCPKMHPYKGDNLYINTYGKRECNICRKEAWTKNNRKRSALAAMSKARSTVMV